ncbi:hypothetical protein QZH41_020535 [Actinostola sp. cb2023]|nr:hypothetical protein QZH41_020535 [Actinostola sp. cb2023]
MAGNAAMPSGYDYEFVVKVPDEYICTICHLTMRKPVQTKCGHRFCKACLDEYNKRNDECPVDRKPIGEERKHPDHQKHCEYQIVNCDNKLQCNVKKPRHQMVIHVQQECQYRMVQCTHCKDMYKFCDLEYVSLHARESNSALRRGLLSLRNIKINKNKVTTDLVDCQVTSHESSECPLTIVPCSFESVGCNFKGKRRDLNDHVMNSTSQHLTITTQQLLSLKKQMKEYSLFSFIWKVEDFSQQQQNAKQEDRDIKLYSEPFHSHKYGYRLKLRLDPNGQRNGKGTHVSVYLIVMRSEYDAILTWPFDWKIKLILLDQKPDNSLRKNIEKGFTPDSTNLGHFKRPTTDENLGLGYGTFVSHETLATENYVVDGTLFLQLEAEKP